MRITVERDLSGLESRFGARRLQDVQARLAMQVGDDSNKFCKEDTGQTKSTMRTSSDFKAGEVTWSTPYAKDAYYDPRVRTVKNPSATSRWFETAKSQRLRSWLELVRRNLGAK